MVLRISCLKGAV